MKWFSRKLFVFLFTSFLFAAGFYITVINAPQHTSTIGMTIIVTIGFFASVYCGSNVMDKYLKLKGKEGDDGR